MTINVLPQYLPDRNRPFFDQVERIQPAEGRSKTGDVRGRTTSKGYWSPGQIAVLQQAITNTKGQQALSKDTLKLVNQLAQEGEGEYHSKVACRMKLSRLIFKQKLIRAIDPSGMMSASEIGRQKRKPVVGEDLEKLKGMHMDKVPVNEIAIALKRDVSAIMTAIQKMNAKSAGNDAPRTIIHQPDDSEVSSMGNSQSKAILFNDHEILPSGYYPITSTEPEGPGKRTVAPAAGGSQAKRVKVAARSQGQPWSANQLKVLREAIEKANHSPIENYGPILDAVNALAAIGDGGSHNLKACFAKVYKLRLDDKIRYAIDPAGRMSEWEIDWYMNRPVLGHELEYLSKLHNEGTPLQFMAVLLKRKPHQIESAIKMLKSAQAD